MSYVCTDIEPTNEPITLDIAIEHLYLPDNVNLDLLQIYITSARQWVEKYTGLHMVPKKIVYTGPLFKSILLQYKVDKILTAKADGISIMVAKCADYSVKVYGSGNEIILEYNSLPEYNKSLVTAALLIVGHMYENRQIVETKIGNAKMLLEPYRIINPKQ
jgi:hypothetical protein